MKFNDFRKAVQAYPLVRSTMFESITHTPQLLRVQLTSWIKQGYVYRLKRGLYCLHEDFQQTSLSSKCFVFSFVYQL